MKFMSTKSLQAHMAEMDEGETLVIITPFRRIVFECKVAEKREPKIEDSGASHIFYDEFPDLMLLDSASGPIAQLRERFVGSIVDTKPTADLCEAMVKTLALGPDSVDEETLPKSKNQGPQQRRKFPVPK